MKPPWRWAACVVALGLVVTGCGRSAPKQSAPGQTGGERPAAAASRPIREQLLAGAVTILSGLDRYDEARGAEQVLDRLVQWSHAAGDAANWRPDPLLE